ncbi:MAG: J domain-containing protein [Chthoniobacter sp.]|nr:J domain-containing protein [Chthoniobacter sp.]
MRRYIDNCSIATIAILTECDEQGVRQACNAALRAFCVTLWKCGVRNKAKPVRKTAAATSCPQKGQTAGARTCMHQDRASEVTPRPRPTIIGAGKIPTSLLKGPLTEEKSLRLFQISSTDPFEIRQKAYRRLIKQYHPDKVFSADPETKMRAEDLSKRINLAWEMVGGA